MQRPASTSSPGATTTATTTTTAAAAAAAAVATAPDGTVMLPAPLALQATVLSQPVFFPSFGDEMADIAEEGDILFPVLGDPWRRVCHASQQAPRRSSSSAGAPSPPPPSPPPLSLCASTSFCVRPALTLPRKVGVSLAGEEFRALLCLRNSAAYELSQVHLNVGVAQPSTPVRRVVLRRTLARLPPRSHYTVVAAVSLGEASTYTLAVAADYSDPSERQRQLTWSSTLKAEQPVAEAVPRSLRAVRQALSPWTPSGGDVDVDVGAAAARAYTVYRLCIGLRNMSTVPLCLTDYELVLPPVTHHSGAAVFCSEAAPVTPHVAALLHPSDTHSLVFPIGILREELRHATVVHGRGGVATRLLSPRLASLGSVRWRWCRAGGEVGAVQSSPLRLEQLLAESEVELGITRVSAGAAPVLLAGSPVTVHVVVVNHSDVHRYDIAVKVRVGHLAPQWLYTGPTVRLLGHLDPQSRVEFVLTLLPWQAGWLHIRRDALEVVDARMMEAVLWPPSTTSTTASSQQQLVVADRGIASDTAAGVDAGDSTAAPAAPAATLPVVASATITATAPPDADTLCHVLVF
ncbi:hypothetical protein NESM_000277200 [Novymonas esmeraldas]|uniref:Trafficking protein particle complex subunit 13 N-terminal domain-containing protein n=1 Tax=Novymonas esmeraldas TaxID=1808958 RepID=A0AAW0FBZ6_9TRYP